MHHIADRIQAGMTAKGLSIAALSEATAIPRMTLSRRLIAPADLTITEIDRIAAALEINPLFLMFGKDAA